MPLLETETFKYQDMQRKVQQGEVCQECGSRLTVAWGGDRYNCYILRCAQDIEHTGSMKPARMSAYDSNLIRTNSLRRQVVEMTGATDLVPYAQTTALKEVQARKILNTIWPAAPEAEKVKAAMVCYQYGLNPLMKHVFLVKFGESWSTVLGIKAKRLIASRVGKYSYLEDTPRVMSKDEQERVFGEMDEVNIVALTVIKDAAGNIYRGYGRWPKDKAPYGIEKGNTKSNMAFIRSESQALERMAPGKLPTGIDVIDEEFVEARSNGNGQQSSPPAGMGEKEAEKIWNQEDAPPPPPSDLTKGKEYPITEEELAWCKEALTKVGWNPLVYINNHYGIRANKVSDALRQMNPDHRAEFKKVLEEKVSDLKREIREDLF